MEVFIVVKKIPVKLDSETKIDFSTNEGVFTSEEKAQEYIKARKKLKDRDDRGCTFGIEPWRVE